MTFRWSIAASLFTALIVSKLEAHDPCDCTYVDPGGYRVAHVDWDEKKIREALAGEEFESMYTAAVDPEAQADVWSSYLEVQTVVQSMPIEMRSQFLSKRRMEILKSPAYADWAKLAPLDRIKERHALEAKDAFSRPYRQTTHSELTGVAPLERAIPLGGWIPLLW